MINKMYEMAKSYKFNYSIIAFILGRFEVFGMINPIIIGYVSVFCFRSGFFPILVGSILGILTLYKNIFLYRYILILFLISFLHILGKSKYRQDLVAALCTLSGGLMFAMYYNFSFVFALISIVEAVLAMALNHILSENLAILNFIDLEVNQIEDYPKEIQRIVGERLKTISNAFNRVSKSCLKAQSEAIRDLQIEDKQEIFDKITEYSCKSCVNVDKCWSENCVESYQAISGAINQWISSGAVNVLDFGDKFRSHCLHCNEIAAASCGYIDRYREKEKWQKKIQSVKQLSVKQIEDAGRVIEDLMIEVTNNMNIDNELSTKIYKGLTSKMVKSAIAIYSGSRLEVYIKIKNCHNCNVCNLEIIPRLNELLEKEFVSVSSECNLSGKACILHLVEKPKLRLNIYSDSLHKDKSSISGDSYTYFQLDKSRYLLALADGMGSGEMAREESAVSIEMYEDFAVAGFNREIILDAINSVLLLDEGRECFSTLDICTVDLYSGMAEFIKIGAVSTIIARGKNIEILRASSLPVGILGQVDKEVFTRQVRKNDVIVMMTDGVIDSSGSILRNEEWILELIKNRANNNPKKIAESIIKKARENYSGVLGDDMTVLVAVVVWCCK